MDKMRGAVEYRLEGPDEIPIITKYIRAEIQTDAAEKLMNDWITMIDAKAVPRSWRVQIEENSRSAGLFVYSGQLRRYVCKLRKYTVMKILGELGKHRREKRGI